MALLQLKYNNSYPSNFHTQRSREELDISIVFLFIFGFYRFTFQQLYNLSLVIQS